MLLVTNHKFEKRVHEKSASNKFLVVEGEFLQAYFNNLGFLGSIDDSILAVDSAKRNNKPNRVYLF